VTDDPSASRARSEHASDTVSRVSQPRFDGARVPTLAGALTAALLSACAAAGSGPEARPPNIVFLLVDDMGWADLESYGSDFHATPCIDRLAAEGMRFTDAYAAAAVCSPTRAAIQTGLDPARLRITDWIPGMWYPAAELRIPEQRMRLGLEHDTLAEVLARAGYASYHVGKWHLGAESHWPEHQGYAANVGGNDKGQPGSYFHPYGKDERSPSFRVRPLPAGGAEGEYLTDRLTDEALALLRTHAATEADAPFFLHLAYYTLHGPYQAKPDKVEQYRARKDPAKRQHHAVYAAMVESLDESVGRILDELDALGLTGDTLVVLTSDNGGVHGVTDNHPLRAGKGLLYEGGVRVCLLARRPGAVPAGTVSDAVVTSTDFLPTFAALAGVPLDAPVDGFDLSATLRDPAVHPERDAVFWHYPHYHTPRRPPCSAVRAGRWKLLEWHADGRVELFDLATDVGETTDLAAARPDVVRDLRARLHSWLAERDAQHAAPNPGHDPDAPFRGGRPRWELVVSDER
jgi:arylsulfatase A-like enzyme